MSRKISLSNSNKDLFRKLVSDATIESSPRNLGTGDQSFSSNFSVLVSSFGDVNGGRISVDSMVHEKLAF